MSAELLHFNNLDVAISPEGRTEGVLPDGQPWIEVNARGFYVGTHRGREYKESDLDSMVDTFSEPLNDEDWDVPVQLDHSDSSRDTVGSARRVWRSGGDLGARLRFVGEAEVKAVRAAKYRKISISVFRFTDDDGNVTYKIREFSVTPFPELEGATIYQKETPMSDKPKAPAPAPSQEHFSADHPALVQMRAEWEAQRRAEREEFDRKLAERDKRIESSEKIIRFQKLTRRIETYGKQGKSVPAMDEAELALLESFSDEQLELYDKLKEASPKYVDFEVVGDQTASEPPKTEEFTEEQAKEEAQKFIDEFATMKARKDA